MYPDDDARVEELAAQPLAIEQILDYLEPLRPGRTSSSRNLPILIDQWDAVSSECIDAAQVQAATVLFDRPEFAQRQAQRLWDRIAVSGHPATSAIRFLPIARRPQAYAATYDFILRWIPFAQYEQAAAIEQVLEETATALNIGGFAIVAGPKGVEQVAQRVGVFQEAANALSETPGVGMVRTILPKMRIRPEVILYLFRKVRRP
jgi:hypothetical protein